MHDALAMSGIERVGQLNCKAQRFVRWQRPTIQSRRQRLALNVLEDQVVHVALAADVVEAADVRMCQGGGGARFAHETFPQQGIAGELVAESP